MSDKIFKGTTWRSTGRIVSGGNRWVFEFRNGDLLTYPVGQPNNPSWSTERRTVGQGDVFRYDLNGDLLVENQKGNIIWRIDTSQIAHNHTGIDDEGRLAFLNVQGGIVRQINNQNRKK